MDSFIKAIVEGKLGSLAIFIGFFLLLIPNVKPIYDIFDAFPKRKLTVLQDFVGEKGATGRTRKVIQEEFDSIGFWYATGIKAERRLREAIINLHELTDGRLKYVDIKRSRSFLSIMQDGTLKVRKFTRLDDFIYLFSFIGSKLLFSFAILALSILIFFPINNPGIRLALLLQVVLLFILAIFYHLQSLPLSAARKIKDEISKIHEKSLYPYTYQELKSNQNSKIILSDAEKEAARKRFESHFGEIDPGFPVGADNEMIDADLVREYRSNHQEE